MKKLIRALFPNLEGGASPTFRLPEMERLLIFHVSLMPHAQGEIVTFGVRFILSPTVKLG